MSAGRGQGWPRERQKQVVGIGHLTVLDFSADNLKGLYCFYQHLLHFISQVKDTMPRTR